MYLLYWKTALFRCFDSPTSLSPADFHWDIQNSSRHGCRKWNAYTGLPPSSPSCVQSTSKMTASTGLLARLTSNKEQCPHCSPLKRTDLNNTPELTFPPPPKWSDLNGPARLTFPLHTPHPQQILKQRQAAPKLHPHGRPPALATTATQLCLHDGTGCF